MYSFTSIFYSSFISIKENTSLLLFNSFIFIITPTPEMVPSKDLIASFIASIVLPVA